MILDFASGEYRKEEVAREIPGANDTFKFLTNFSELLYFWNNVVSLDEILNFASRGYDRDSEVGSLWEPAPMLKREIFWIEENRRIGDLKELLKNYW